MSQEWKWDSGTFKGSSNHCSCLSQGLKAELWGEPSSTRPSAPHHISCETKVLMSSRLSRASLCFSVSSSVGPWCWIREQLTSLLNLKEGKTCFTVSSSRGEENRFVIITQRLCENSSKEFEYSAITQRWCSEWIQISVLSEICKISKDGLLLQLWSQTGAARLLLTAAEENERNKVITMFVWAVICSRWSIGCFCNFLCVTMAKQLWAAFKVTVHVVSSLQAGTCMMGELSSLQLLLSINQ